MPANTPRNFPYPLPTEPVAEGAQRIRELAEALDGNVTGLIQAIVLTGDGVIDFQNIPQIYRHLLLLVSGQSGDAFERTFKVTLNNDGSSVYAQTGLRIVGAGAAANLNASGPSWLVGMAGLPTATEMNYLRMELPDYTLADAFHRKAMIYQAGGNLAGGPFSEFGGGRYYQAAAGIGRITISTPYNLKAGSRAALYGLK